MRFALLVIVAAVAGALTMVAVPATFVSSAAHEVRQIHLAHLNPFRAIFDSGIRAGMNPDALGLRRSSVTLTPMKLTPPASLKLDLSRAFEAQARSQIDQSIRHTQDMQAYTNNPSAWSGPPPN